MSRCPSLPGTARQGPHDSLIFRVHVVLDGVTDKNIARLHQVARKSVADVDVAGFQHPFADVSMLREIHPGRIQQVPIKRIGACQDINLIIRIGQQLCQYRKHFFDFVKIIAYQRLVPDIRKYLGVCLPRVAYFRRAKRCQEIQHKERPNQSRPVPII